MPIISDESGNIFHFDSNLFYHRTDGPAVERCNGTKEWWVNSRRHREDGPAIEHTNGTKEWYINDKRHRINGPAVECANGDKEWWINGKRHREDGPAVDFKNIKEWYYNGQLHRIGGPAVTNLENGFLNKFWYYYGLRHNSNGPAIIKKNIKEWYFLNKLHREDGPAREYSYSFICKEYWIHGKRHREDGPAVINHDPYNFQELWYKNGLLHRLDGPAVLLSEGRKQWSINGNKYYFEDFNSLTYNMLIPSKDKSGDLIYKLRGKIYSPKDLENKIVRSSLIDGTEEYRLNGKLHRIDGPAVIKFPYFAHHIDGVFLTKSKFLNFIKNNKPINYSYL